MYTYAQDARQTRTHTRPGTAEGRDVGQGTTHGPHGDHHEKTWASLSWVRLPLVHTTTPSSSVYSSSFCDTAASNRVVERRHLHIIRKSRPWNSNSSPSRDPPLRWRRSQATRWVGRRRVGGGGRDGERDSRSRTASDDDPVSFSFLSVTRACSHRLSCTCFLEQIATVKGKVESSQGHAASSQKIIYSGKILTDNDTVQSCGVSEKDFLVLMVSKVCLSGVTRGIDSANTRQPTKILTLFCVPVGG